VWLLLLLLLLPLLLLGGSPSPLPVCPSGVVPLGE